MPDDDHAPLAPLAMLPLWLVIVWGMVATPSASTLRTIGGLAQLGGAVLVLIAVDEALNPKQGPIHMRLWRWIERKLRKLLGKTKTVSLKVHDASVALSTAGASVDVAQQRAVSEIERRLEKLEKAHEHLSKQVDRAHKRLDVLRDRLDSSMDALRTSIKALEEANETATRKRARWDLGGGAFFVQGIVLATWSETIARWLA